MRIHLISLLALAFSFGGPAEASSAGSTKVQTSASGQRLSSIPADFHGKWREDPAECSDMTEYALDLEAGRVSYYAHGGPVKSVRQSGPRSIVVTYTSHEDEFGTKEDLTVSFEVGDGGHILTASTLSGEPSRYIRCDSSPAKEAPPLPARAPDRPSNSASLPQLRKGNDIALEFPLKCADPKCLVRYDNGPFQQGMMTSLLDHSMSDNGNGFWQYGNIGNGRGDGVIVGYDGSKAAGPGKRKDNTCIAGDLDLGGLLNDRGCGAGYVSYDEHPGYDYRAAVGTEVFAAAPGKVVSQSGQRCILNNMGSSCDAWGVVGIDHGNGIVTQYAHLSEILVTAGDDIRPGQLIGKSGNKSPPNVTLGAHLHFEVLLKVSSGYAVIDPYGWTGEPPDPLYSTSEWRGATLWKTDFGTGPSAVSTTDSLASERTQVWVTSPANVRDKPSTSGSQVLATREAGSLMSGTWVSGEDRKSRWLKVELAAMELYSPRGEFGYVWDGNLATADNTLVGTWELVGEQCCGDQALEGSLRWEPAASNRRERVTFFGDGRFTSNRSHDPAGSYRIWRDDEGYIGGVDGWISYSVGVKLQGQTMTVQHVPTSVRNAYSQLWQRITQETSSRPSSAGTDRTSPDDVALAQAAETVWRSPGAGSPERKQIMDAMRPPFEKALAGKVVFKVNELRVTATHAFASVAPLRPDGRPHRIMVDAPMDAYGEAILQRRGTGWTVVDWNIGATDVWYCQLTARGVPKSILPYC
jgi:murein DD-endopeptidase MepM/ murein hydrolase activator NlpD